MDKKKKEEMFKQLIDENSERIVRICRYYNPNPEDRKDMYQEILVNVWKSLDTFRGDSKISTWVYRIAINTSLSYTGKAFRQMKLMVDKDVQNMGLLVDDELQLKKKIVATCPYRAICSGACGYCQYFMPCFLLYFPFTKIQSTKP
jgi:RNA polymerase sigma-70 factor (ECF subfamily)